MGGRSTSLQPSNQEANTVIPIIFGRWPEAASAHMSGSCAQAEYVGIVRSHVKSREISAKGCNALIRMMKT